MPIANRHYIPGHVWHRSEGDVVKAPVKTGEVLRMEES
jgi:hypothetical protein